MILISIRRFVLGVFSAVLLLAVVGCSTTGTFVVPDNSQLYINNRSEAVTVGTDGKVETRPYFWSAIGGVPYRLEQDGKTLKQGKLKAKFRPVSIFWPPYGMIYWPAGLDPDVKYDLVNDTQEYK